MAAWGTSQIFNEINTQMSQSQKMAKKIYSVGLRFWRP